MASKPYCIICGRDSPREVLFRSVCGLCHNENNRLGFKRYWNLDREEVFS